MPSRTLKLSARMQLLMDQGKLEQKLTELNKQSGEWYLGRAEENRGDGTSPLDRGFGKATTRVKKYPKYNPYYEAIRKPGNWLVQSGALREYVRHQSDVVARRNYFTISVPVKPKSKGPAAYAGIHQHGGEIVITKKARMFFKRMSEETGHLMWRILFKKKTPIKIPARPYLSWDDVDGRAWSRFATKWLNIHLGFSKSEL